MNTIGRDASQSLKTSNLNKDNNRKQNTILMEWMKLSFLDQLVNARNYFANSASGIMLGSERLFRLFDFIVIIATNPYSHST